MFPNAETRNCPNCWASDYIPWLMTSTCVYYPPRIVDGVNVNPDMNKTTEERFCNNCKTTTNV